MKHWKKSFIFLISFTCLGIVIAIACSGGDWDETEGSMFAPQLINKPAYEPFFRAQNTPFYGGNYYTDQNTACNELNLDEWSAYFEGKVKKEALTYWLYQADPKEVNNMIFTIKGTTKDVPKLNEESKKNTLLPQASDKTTPFLYYVGFAKRNESFAVSNNSAWEETKEKPVDISKQIEGGMKFFSNAKNPVLKERYLFQVVRLYYFNRQYKEAIDFYTANTSSFTSGNSMQWRAMEYVAGAHYKQKEYAQANYLYSLVYDHFAAHRNSAYLSFHPQEEQDWKQSLAFAKSAHEKAVLWQLFGIYNDPGRAIDEIYKLDPKAPELDLLLVRLVNIEEERFIPKLMRKTGRSKEETTGPDKNEVNTISTIAAKGNISNPMLWNLAAAYLNYEVADYSKGDGFLKAAEKAKSSGDLLKAQYHIISLTGKLGKAGKMNASLEKELLPDLLVLFDAKTKDIPSLRYSFAQGWARNVLAVLYAENGEYEKAEMIQPGTVADYAVSDDNIKKMIAYYDKKDHSELESFFLSKDLRSAYDYSLLLAIRYTQQDKLDLALQTFKAIQSTETLPGNPFTIHIKDCHDCDHLAPQKTTYTIISFVEKMIEMKNKAKSDKAQAAQNYFLVANGFYNCTYYGNDRYFYENRIRYYGNYYWNYSDDKPYAELDCNLALSYYLLARDNSTDKEFKAKCTFMAAKCVQNNGYSLVAPGGKDGGERDDYFLQLKKEYASTRYYSEILKECSYFNMYVKK